MLASLFRLDHLATRMRRNAESLLVLAGIDPPRKWSAPLRLNDVVRAALGEVEDYHRVTAQDFGAVTVMGSVGADLAHLVAELVENALTFSPPGAPVEVRGRPRPDGGFAVAIVDAGRGMPDHEITAANRRLAGRESFTVAPSKYLGHYVAGHLAARHGIALRLEPRSGDGDGIVAVIELPAALFVADGRPGAARPAVPVGGGAGPAAGAARRRRRPCGPPAGRAPAARLGGSGARPDPPGCARSRRTPRRPCRRGRRRPTASSCRRSTPTPRGAPRSGRPRRPRTGLPTWPSARPGARPAARRGTGRRRPGARRWPAGTPARRRCPPTWPRSAGRRVAPRATGRRRRARRRTSTRSSPTSPPACARGRRRPAGGAAGRAEARRGGCRGTWQCVRMLADSWDSLTTQLDPSSALVLATGAGALVAVVVDVIWLRARHVVTIVHEGGHALAALLTGRRLTGIKLHSNTSGLTLSVGKPTGPGMVITAAAGYISPSLVGLLGVVLLAFDQVTVMLWAGTVVLVAMLIMVRNLYGALALVVTGAVVVCVSLFTEPEVQAAFAYAMTWFLLRGGRAAGQRAAPAAPPPAGRQHRRRHPGPHHARFRPAAGSGCSASARSPPSAAAPTCCSPERRVLARAVSRRRCRRSRPRRWPAPASRRASRR